MSRNYSVVGHRGFPHNYPENSLVGMVAAAKAGVAAVELDVQLSADHVPVVFHDGTLDRITEKTGPVWQYDAATLATISAHEPQRWGAEFKPTCISTLEDVCQAVRPYTCNMFVEIKEESLEQFGRQLMLDKVLEASKCLGDRRKIISFDLEVLKLVRKACHLPIGWVLNDYNDDILAQAKALNPEILAYDVKKLNRGQYLWQGNWSWFLYDIVNQDDARYWHGKGVQYIETWDAESI